MCRAHSKHCLVLREYFSQILIFENCTEEEMQKKQIHQNKKQKNASLMSLKWIEPSILGFKQITLAKTNANDLK